MFAPRLAKNQVTVRCILLRYLLAWGCRRNTFSHAMPPANDGKQALLHHLTSTEPSGTPSDPSTARGTLHSTKAGKIPSYCRK